MTTVIALGGNALMRAGERGTAAEQLANLREACAAMAPLLDDPDVVLTHRKRSPGRERARTPGTAADEVPPLPLYVAVAQTQAEIGTLIETELRPVAGRPVACVLTHVRVDDADPAFAEPTKPVGPFYAAEKAEELERDRGWRLKPDAGRGYRRVVPSPAPLEIIELGAIKALLAAGTCTIACGGGGIPVASATAAWAGSTPSSNKVTYASALLASELGAGRLVILTDVPAVLRGYGTRTRSRSVRSTGRGGGSFFAELAEGSMRRRSKPRSSSSARPEARL